MFDEGHSVKFLTGHYSCPVMVLMTRRADDALQAPEQTTKQDLIQQTIRVTMNKFSRISKKLASLPLIKPLPWRLPLKFVPQPLQLFALQKAANILLKEQLEDGELDFLDGPFLRVQVQDLSYDWGVCKRGMQLAFFPGVEGADVSFSANSSDLVLLASRREDADTLFFQRRLKIEGDTELGLQVKNLIDAIDLEQFPALFNKALEFGADMLEPQPS